MKRLLSVSSILLLLSGCIARPVVTNSDSPEHFAQNEIIKQNVLKSAKTGDWLVIRGYHPTDHLVSNASGIPISHVGIFNSKSLQIIEAEGEGVHLSGLNEFIDKSYRLLIIRPRWRTESNAVLAWGEAEKYVGSSYDFLGTIGFDFPKRYYCSELAVHIYAKWYGGKEKFPAVIKPGELYLYGKILYDSLPRDEI